MRPLIERRTKERMNDKERLSMTDELNKKRMTEKSSPL